MKQRSFEDSFCVSEETSLKNETEVLEHDFLISSSLKNETTYEDSVFISVETSLKNETEVKSIILVSVSSSLKNEIEAASFHAGGNHEHSFSSLWQSC